ncbi:MAG: NUDIX hydrolase [Alicyclobacillus sp.]|nr:NUDIX hydrolase [Alicyclobacillus sp.]
MTEANQKLVETKQGARRVYDGGIIRVEQWQVILPNGRPASRDVVLHPGAVAVLAEPTPDELLLVRQYRTAPGTVLYEIPAGKLDAGESPEACAARELAEETGYQAARLRRLYEFYTSPGFSDEKIFLFHATQLQPGRVHLDEDEFVTVEVCRKAHVRRLMEAGCIQDAKTLVALLWWLGGGPASEGGRLHV